MQTELTLSFTDATGQTRRVVVRSAPFHIGRSPDNDLHIADSNLSRRHARIEHAGGAWHVSDCGSSNGTLVNGAYLSAPALLRDGDTLTLGGSCQMSVSIRPVSDNMTHAASGPPAFVPSYTPGQGAPPAQPSASRSTSLPSWLTPPVIAAVISGAVLLFVGALLFALTRTGDSGRARSRRDGDEYTSNSNRASRSNNDSSDSDDNSATRDSSSNSNSETESASNSDTNTGADNKQSSSPSNAVAPDSNATATTNVNTLPALPAPVADSDEQVGKVAARVMSGLSTDNAPYISAGGVRDVAARVRTYRGSTALASKLNAMRQGCSEISAEARRNNLRAPLVVYAALAATDGGGDPVAAARQMMPKLLTLRATFGTGTANSALLTVAAYTYAFDPPIGSQQRVAHPLYVKLIQAGGAKSSNVDTSVARSVWFLREKNMITQEAYDLAVRTVAVGIVAQNPQQYGISAAPLLCS